MIKTQWGRPAVRHLIAATCLLLLLAASTVAAASQAILPREPTIHGQWVVFVYADRLWSVSVRGGEAHPLTSGPGMASHPHFSPDGQLIAFSLDRGGSENVYLMSATGGHLKRLTWHPGADVVIGFTPDGKSVLFRSERNSYRSFDRLFTISVKGGFPQQLPLPTAEDGSYSPDGSRIAYVPFSYLSTGMAFKHYRGGRQARIWIAKLSDSSIVRLPRADSRNFNPMWIGNEIYFLSDRTNGAVTLYRYDTRDGKVTEVLPAEAPDVKSASSDGRQIVYETVGALHVFDVASGKSQRIPIHVAPSLVAVHPHDIKVAKQIVSSGISPTGVRAVFAAHGDILTVPVQGDDIRNITQSPGADDRYPAWSPDGKWLAYFSDRSGDYALYLSRQDGLSLPKRIDLHHPGLFYYSPVWSPDSKKIAYIDQFHTLWCVDLASGKVAKVATDYYYSINKVVGRPTFGEKFSPDSRFLAYAQLMPNHMRSVFIYSLETGRSWRITDAGADARFVAWDASGKYLYFAASTTMGPAAGWIDMSSYDRPVTRHLYAVVLGSNQPSPLAPKKTNDRGIQRVAAKHVDHELPAKQQPVKIDFQSIQQRIVALPFPAKRITGLQAAGPGVVFVAVGKPLYVSTDRAGPQGEPQTLYKLDLASRKPSKYLDNVATFSVSADGKWLLYGQPGKGGDKWAIAATDAPDGSHDAHVLATGDMEVRVDPRAEWKEMYAEEWRIIRDFFYDSNLHGLDSHKAEALYQPYVDNLASKSGLDYIFNDMRGELVNSHVFSGNPFAHQSKQPQTGLLGADYTIESNRYRLSRIYTAGNWNPDLEAPLARPGLNVHAGDYLLAVNGRKLTGSDNVYQFFAGTAGKPTTIDVGPNPSGKGAHEIVVVPMRDEKPLREDAWINHNVEEVNRLSQGKIAYVYLPDTAKGGYTNFNRYFFSQVDKQALIIDERFNGGGFISDYIIDYLRRNLQNYWRTREGHVFSDPEGAIFGPKAMLTNGFSVSGGDALPWLFKEQHLGPLIGMRTTGGLNAVAGVPPLMDGTFASVPRMAIYSPEGKRVVENRGVTPDIRVPLSPQAWRQGRDPQLERAVAVLMQDLNQHPETHVKPPAFLDYHQHPAVSPPRSGDER